MILMWQTYINCKSLIATIGSNMVSTTDTLQVVTINIIGTNFNFNSVTEAKVNKIIDQMIQSSSGYDGTSTVLLKIIWLYPEL